MVRTKKLSRWGKSKKFSHPFCLPHLNTWWMPDDADFCLPPVVNKTVFFPGLFGACFCYTANLGLDHARKSAFCFFFQAFPQRFSILSIMMTWIMMFFFFLFFRFASFFYIFHIMSMQKADAYYCTLFCLCLWSRLYIYIIDKIINMEKHMEIPRNSSWIRSKTWKNTWKIQGPHHG